MMWFPLTKPQDGLISEATDAELRTIRAGSGWGKGKRPGADDGWIGEGLRNTRIHKDDLWHFPTIREEINFFCENIDALPVAVSQILINSMEPGSALAPHRDGAPWRERWHMVIQTNPRVFWTDAIYGTRHLAVGWNGPVCYCGVLHSMINRGDNERIHIIVDIDRLELL